jgi:putative ABC transport system ATP-binding protein
MGGPEMLSTMSNGPVFRFEHVTVRGDRDEAILVDLDLVLDIPGVTAILGPSGAGKTTLLRLCNRLEVPADGRVLLDGVDLALLDPIALRRRVGMVFQTPVLFAGTVRDNLAVASPDLAEGGAAALERVGLARELLERQADDLSGGEAQRLCIARTLLTEPDVVLMDEPTSSLDRANRDVIEDLTRALADSGIAIVWVTHDVAQAHRLASKVMVLVDGKPATEAEAAAFVKLDVRTDDEGDGFDAGN